MRASNARFGSRGKDKILFRLMETPTKIRLARAAEAPTSAIKKFSQPVICNVLAFQ
jgi:hypothetical protein